MMDFRSIKYGLNLKLAATQGCGGSGQLTAWLVNCMGLVSLLLRPTHFECLHKE